MGVIASENFGYLLDPGLRNIFVGEYSLPESQVDRIYGVESSSKATEYDYGIGGLGDLEEFDGTIPYGDFQGQYRISFTHKEWVKGMKVERKLVDDDQYSIINNRPRALGLVSQRTREKHGASVFNNAFNTSVFTGGDSKALCATDHTWEGTSSSQSNKGTTSLSKTSLASARLAMRGFTDDTDNLLTAKGDTLIVPPELEQTAFELMKSDKEINTANNNANFFRGMYNVIVWDYLSDSNDWFLIDSRYAKLFLKWFSRIPTEFNKDKDFDTYKSGSFTSNSEKQTDEIAGSPNVKPWVISREALN